MLHQDMMAPTNVLQSPIVRRTLASGCIHVSSGDRECKPTRTRLELNTFYYRLEVIELSLAVVVRLSASGQQTFEICKKMNMYV